MASRWQLLVGLLALGLLTACSAPPELEGRPPSPADASAVSLLPPGAIERIAYAHTDDAAQVTTGDGGRLTALRFASQEEAYGEFKRRRDTRIGSEELGQRTEVDVGATRYIRYTATSASVLAWQSNNWIFIAEAPDEAALSALIAASRVGGMGPRGPFGQPWAIVAMLATAATLTGALTCGTIRLALRGMAVPPAAGTPVLGSAELRQRLIALNAPERPWQIRAGLDGELIAEWRYADAAWWGVLSRSAVRRAYRLRLYMDEARHGCHALDEFGDIQWSAGLVAAPRIHYRRTFFRGVQLLRRERGVAYGLKTPLGSPGKVLDYRFDIDDVKRPIVDVVTAAGWTYQPILWPPMRRSAEARA